ncbi:hypothetical protein Hanom_Chr14g01332561 [Helianthus anomalus]
MRAIKDEKNSMERKIPDKRVMGRRRIDDDGWRWLSASGNGEYEVEVVCSRSAFIVIKLDVGGGRVMSI